MYNYSLIDYKIVRTDSVRLFLFYHNELWLLRIGAVACSKILSKILLFEYTTKY